MDSQLSILMANQAKVSDGDLILDPFVGSGSLLVAAAEFGGYVFGSDIDYLMLHGKTKPTRIKTEVFHCSSLAILLKLFTFAVFRNAIVMKASKPTCNNTVYRIVMLMFWSVIFP